MDTWVALLRGINLGGHNKVPMKELKPLFVNAGCDNVRTYIQSGNVVFDASMDLAARVPELMAARIEESFGVRTWLTIRSREEMRQTIANNPFADLNAPPTSVAVSFLAEPPKDGTIAYSKADESVPDKIIIAGKDVYLYLPNGFSGSKLNPKFFTKGLTAGTTRNWRTITRLMATMDESS